jgi:hypothetical protein
VAAAAAVSRAFDRTGVSATSVARGATAGAQRNFWFHVRRQLFSRGMKFYSWHYALTSLRLAGKIKRRWGDNEGNVLQLR